MRVALTTESYLPYVSGVTVSVDALARGLGARGHEVLVLAPRPAPGERAAAGRLAGAGAARSPGLPSYQLPRLVPPAYRMAWPNPWAGALRDGRELAAGRRPRPLAVRHRPAGAEPGAGGRRAPRLHPPHPLRGLRPLPRPAGRTGLGPDRCLPAALLGRLRGDRRAVERPRRRDPRAAAGGPPRTGARRADRDRRRRHPRAGTGRPAAGGRLAGRRDRDRHAGPAGAGEERRGHPRRRGGRLRARAEGAPARHRRRPVGGRAAAPRGGLRRPCPPDRARCRGSRPSRGSAASDLFAFASRTETQGLVLAEALAAGLPAVAVEGPGVADSVRDGVDGRIVPAEPAATRASASGRGAGGAGRGHRAARAAWPSGRGTTPTASRCRIGSPRWRRSTASRWRADEGFGGFACAAIGRAYNAAHASESGGPLRLPSIHRLRFEPPFGASVHAWTCPIADGLPPSAPPRAVDGERQRAALPDQPLPVPRRRPGRPPARPPPRAPVRVAALPPRVAAAGCRSCEPRAPRRPAASSTASSTGASRSPSPIGAARRCGRCRRARPMPARRSRRPPSARRARRPGSRSRSSAACARSATSSCAARPASTRASTSSSCAPSAAARRTTTPSSTRSAGSTCHEALALLTHATERSVVEEAAVALGAGPGPDAVTAGARA